MLRVFAAFPTILVSTKTSKSPHLHEDLHGFYCKARRVVQQHKAFVMRVIRSDPQTDTTRTSPGPGHVLDALPKKITALGLWKMWKRWEISNKCSICTLWTPKHLKKIADFEWKDVETDLPTSSNSLAGSMDVCGHLGDGNLVISGPPTGNRKTLCMQKLPFFWLCFVVIWKILEQ